MTRKFAHLRVTPWAPTFTWVAMAWEAADQINSFHEDYPKYVVATQIALSDLVAKLGLTGPSTMWPLGYKIPSSRLLEIHRRIFGKSLAGGWRELRVTVGLHRPPPPEQVPGLMAELEEAHRIMTVEDLEAWYYDFETIHPFQDGNGRVGGIIVAAYAAHFHPDKGWLAANQ